MNLKGSLPLLILHMLSRGPNHGYAIALAIRTLSADVLSYGEGTLYPALHALEERGLIESSEAADVAGRVRRRYRITEAGLVALEKERADWLRYSQAITAVLGHPEGGQP